MKKRIIYISHWRFPSEKTMSPLIMKTCEGFIAQGFEVELWIPRRPDPQFASVDPFIKYDIKERFPIRVLPSFALASWLGKAGFLLMVASFNISVFFRLIKQRIGKGKSGIQTIIYGHDIRDFILPSLLGLPLFIEIHDFYKSSVCIVNRLMFRNARGLIVTNALKGRAISESYGFPKERMIIQPNAVSFEMFDIAVSKEAAREKLGLPFGVNIVLYTGHLFSWKGVHTLAEASSYMPDEALIYFVGGTSEDRKALREFVAERKLPRIIFLPHQEHNQVPLFLKAADVLVLPNTAKEIASKYETSPVKLFEYMASGTPVVASDLPSIREIVSEKEVSFFNADDPKSLAAVIENVLKDPDRVHMRVCAAKDLAKKCSWASRARAISDFIRRMDLT